MRIMIDSNVLVSAVLFPESKLGKIVKNIEFEHTLVICSYSLREVQHVFKKKFLSEWNEMNTYIHSLRYELFETLNSDIKYYEDIRDASDLPILISFIESGAGMFITGDMDFFTPELSKYNICTPEYYYRNYMNINMNFE